jgi:hypothetical protein
MPHEPAADTRRDDRVGQGLSLGGLLVRPGGAVRVPRTISARRRSLGNCEVRLWQVRDLPAACPIWCETSSIVASRAVAQIARTAIGSAGCGRVVHRKAVTVTRSRRTGLPGRSSCRLRRDDQRAGPGHRRQRDGVVRSEPGHLAGRRADRPRHPRHPRRPKHVVGRSTTAARSWAQLDARRAARRAARDAVVPRPRPVSRRLSLLGTAWCSSWHRAPPIGYRSSVHRFLRWMVSVPASSWPNSTTVSSPAAVR